MKETLQEIFAKRKYEFFGIILIVLAILNAINLLSQDTGIIGDSLARGLRFIIGQGIYTIPFLLLIWGIKMIYNSKIKVKISSRMVGVMVIVLNFLIASHLGIEHPQEFEAGLQGQGGGIIGAVFLYILRKFFAEVGAYVVLAALFLIGILLLTDVLLINLLLKAKVKIEKIFTIFKDKSIARKEKLKDKLSNFIPSVKAFFAKLKKNNTTSQQNKEKTDSKSKQAAGSNKKEKNKSRISKQKKKAKKKPKRAKKIKKKKKVKKSKDKTASKQPTTSSSNLQARQEVAATAEKVKQDTTEQEVVTNKDNQPKKRIKKRLETDSAKQEQLDFDEYQLPDLSLLNLDEKEVDGFVDKTEILKETLDNFGVRAEITDVNYGPTITRYEIHPAPGTKVSKILNLADDIALSLAATDIRIEAPIPGKSAVGIEIPNQEQSLVTLGAILEKEEFQAAESKLTIGLGKDIDGNPAVADLAKMPHMLVAGATGSGKSVFINSIISSILYKATPDQVKFLLIDPKMVELTIYKKIPHLVAPVVTDPKKASSALRWVVQEMENRYELFAASGARGIDSYNRYLKEKDKDPLPYVVVIIDELADLMMVSAAQVEDAICRLAQKARAAGIHLVLATQRPSVDVITGVIKANIPTRVSFALSSQADSRTILDTGGAEKLLGKGDMLFAPVDANQPRRLQGAFISDAELNQVVDFIKKQDTPEYAGKIAKIKNKDVDIKLEDDKDELYEKAVRLVVNNRASISMLQRKLRIGYNRAARMIDTMEEENIVGPHRGSKAREVLISKEEMEKMLADD
ncbi:DNA translocase FtsK [Natroniella sulfidigena]|uniref:FtsK/SpoIIIE family DNA translocase n=1 Tax=Natroniella sulfidigena TaxID=723921 RepID=UPI00200B5696|nr:DNA translocase FtsK [Natroniella sulfidigena]MCK8817996.1 DNA translocase FtsK [Natroniella sulfidigena]